MLAQSDYDAEFRSIRFRTMSACNYIISNIYFANRWLPSAIAPIYREIKGCM